MPRRIVFAFALVAANGAVAQSRIDRPVAVTRLTERSGDRAKATADWLSLSDGRGTAVGAVGRDDPAVRRLAPVASAVLPGSGQFILREDRFILYAAIEAAFWWKRGKDRADQRRQEADFRRLARDVARSLFSSNPPEAGWEYYEEMRKFLESGVYSLGTNGALVPETDQSTFNGALWKSVLEHNPDMASALTEYEQRAIKPEFRWSWRNAQLEWDQYKRTTDQRNDAAAAVASDLAVIGAIHVVSMVDAFRSLRLQAVRRPGAGIGVEGSLRWPSW